MKDMPSIVGKNFYDSFNEYVVDFPDGERFRAWLTGEVESDRLGKKKNKQIRSFEPRSVLILKGEGPHGGLPGGYIWANISVFGKDTYGVFVHDNDDGLMVKKFKNTDDAEKGLEELKELAPITYIGDLKLFGFEWE